ncbi:35187_t:CDS:2, partial [Gigaspora margarita]
MDKRKSDILKKLQLEEMIYKFAKIKNTSKTSKESKNIISTKNKLEKCKKRVTKFLKKKIVLGQVLNFTV